MSGSACCALKPLHMLKQTPKLVSSIEIKLLDWKIEMITKEPRGQQEKGKNFLIQIEE